MRLLELFDQPYDITWMDGDIYEASARFKTDQNNTVTVQFSRARGVWNIDFYIELLLPSGRMHRTYKMTGQGDAPRIIATVLKVIGEFLQGWKPRWLYFTSGHDEPGRTKLYRAVVNRLASQAGLEYITDMDDPRIPEPIRASLIGTSWRSLDIGFLLKNTAVY